MKKLLFALLFVMGAVTGAVAQTSTYILVRHAEKDTMRLDPPLTPAGEQRAQKLLDVLKEYTPDAIFSTNYMRTRATVTPLAQKFNRQIEIYDPRQQEALAAKLLAMEGKTVVVAGHSNTVPALANLLIKEKKYADLDEKVYNQFWIVTVTDGKATARVVTY